MNDRGICGSLTRSRSGKQRSDNITSRIVINHNRSENRRSRVIRNLN
jgi:hypothetical protein